MDITLFYELSNIFSEKGFFLYLVGGAIRDFLLKKENYDYDFVSNATPEDIKNIFPDGDFSFAKYGSCKILYKNNYIDIVTLRTETYDHSFRVPSSITFTSSIEEDSKRRDFTINALYMDKNNKIYDFHNGLEDLNNKIIRIIGDPDERFYEDPLRILRCLRFALNLNFNIEKETEKSLIRNLSLLKEISYNLIFKELEKMSAYDGYENIINKYHLKDYIFLHRIKRKLNVIDMHADTLTRCYDEKKHLFNNNLHIDVQKLYQGEYLLQCLAIFLNQKDGNIFERFKMYYDFFIKEIEANKNTLVFVKNYDDFLNAKLHSKIGIMLSIEEGEVLENDLSRLDYLYSLGVRMMSLSWNYNNCICNENGLTDFGIQVVRKMNEIGMIIDVSHLNDKAFFDVMRYSNKPVVASHSNCRTIKNVKRNLSDEMLILLKEKKGLIGINYYKDFVGETLINHIKHLIDLGLINNIALGSDFDGMDNPCEINDASKIKVLESKLLESGISKKSINKIFYENFERLLKCILK